MVPSSNLVRVSLGLLAVGLLAATFTLSSRAQDRNAEVVLAEIDAIKLPDLDPSKREDRDYMMKYFLDRQKATEQKAELVGELNRVAPDHERLPELLVERWMSIPPVGAKGAELTREIDEVLARTKNEKLKVEGAFARVRIAVIGNQGDVVKAMPQIEEFLKVAPKDPRSAQLLYMGARRMEDKAKRAELEDRILSDFPDAPFAEMIKADRRRAEAIGKPFELAFNDAVTGSAVDMKGLKGKVVVIDFWATWCGPCVAEMPRMKELYGKYKDQGVEFIGVSLDQPEEDGGLDALKKFVAEKEVPWPQYYQGKGWESDFSRSWGINAIPAMFVVDQEGNLFSTEARENLESIIPDLLKKSDGKTEAGAGGQ